MCASAKDTDWNGGGTDRNGRGWIGGAGPRRGILGCSDWGKCLVHNFAITYCKYHCVVRFIDAWLL